MFKRAAAPAEVVKEHYRLIINGNVEPNCRHRRGKPRITTSANCAAPGAAATTAAPCGCGVGFELLRPGEPAARAVAAHPEQSDRALAKAARVSHQTVARQRTKSTGPNGPVARHTGGDNRTRTATPRRPKANGHADVNAIR
jgi:hypothetical protein